MVCRSRKPPGTFFQIGFEIEIRIDKARVAFVLLVLLGEKKLARVEVLLHGVLQFPEQPCIADKQARFEQVGLHGDVGGFAQALRHGTDAVSDFQADVPQHADQLMQLLLQGCIRFISIQ